MLPALELPSPHEMGDRRARWVTRARWLPLVAGLCWFAGNSLNVIHARMRTPPGTQAVWTAREIDIAQHLTWINAMTHAAVIPNYHLPAATTPGLFSGLTWLLGHLARLGIDAAV